MHELIRKDLVYKITAVFLALLLWFYVTSLQNPTTEKSVTVPVAYNGLKEGLITGNKTPSVDVRIKGPRSVINPLAAKDITAWVDLSQAKIGEHSFPVQLTLPAGVELVNYTSNVSLLIDAILEKQLPILVKTVNEVAQGYSSFEPVLTPSRVVIRGAQQLLETVDSVQVTVDLNMTTDNLMLNLPVNIIDKSGNYVPAGTLEINPKTIQVFVPVIQNVPTKTVPIKPTLIGQPKEDWRVARVVLEPETVKISGPFEKLNNVDHVVTQPIDITGIEQNLVTQAALTTPEGVSLLYGPVVKVLIQLEEAPITKTFTELPVSVENQPAGTQVKLNPQKISATIQGSKKEMEALRAKDIKAVVDLKGLENGVQQVEVRIILPDILQVVKVEPGTLEATIAPETD